MNLYTTIYNMCTQKPPHDYSAELYARYGAAFTRYNEEQVSCERGLVEKNVFFVFVFWSCFPPFFTPPRHPITPPFPTHTQVLPSLQGQHGDFLLTQMWTRWSNTRVMQRWLARFFNYLDR